MQVEYDVFLSHSGDQTGAAQELARRLKGEGLKPWLDRHHLVPGEGWLLELEQALRECASCAVLVGPAGLGGWQEEEIRLAVDLRVKTRGEFRVIPVLLPGTDGTIRDALPEVLKATTWVEFGNGTLDDPEALHRLVCGVRGVRPQEGPGQPGFEGECPYRGLEAFDAQHARFFFGREASVENLLERLRPMKQRFLGIVGPSGSGKSSLALAGLVPGLNRGALKGSAAWPVVVCRPGPNPLESLAAALVRAFGTGLGELRKLIEELTCDTKALHRFALVALPEARTERPLLVILVDQFEEVFSLCNSEELRQAFIANLLEAAREPGGRVVVVLTLRADFYGRCALYPALAEALSSDQQLLVGPLTTDELRRAIERPAQMVGCELEPGLVETLVHAVADQPGALPLLQYTLLELWERRAGRRLTKAVYDSVGGVHGALENRANAELENFSEPERELCRRIFLRLTLPGEGTEDTKRRAVFPELLVGGADLQAVEQVVNRLADARLITTEAGEQDPKQRYVEVAHEALIGHWGRLRGWIDADRDFLRVRLRVADAAARWRQEGRRADFLLPEGKPLAEARELLADRKADLEAELVEFVEASLKHWRHQRQRRIGVMATVATAFVALLIVGSLRAAHDARVTRDAWRKERDARQREAAQHRAAQLNAARVDFDHGMTLCEAGEMAHGLLWLARGLEITPLDDAETLGHTIRANMAGLLSQLRPLKAFFWHAGAAAGSVESDLRSVAFSPDGRTILTGCMNETAQLWNARDGTPIGPPMRHPAPVWACAFSADGRLVVTGSTAQARLWDAATGRALGDPVPQPQPAFAVAFGSDGKSFFTVNEDRYLRAWSIENGKLLSSRPLRADLSLRKAVFDAGAKKLLTAHSDKTARVWDVATGRQLGEPIQYEFDVWALALSHDGRRSAIGDQSGVARVWDLTSHSPIGAPIRRAGSIEAITFSPDGRTILIGSADQTAGLWDASSGEPIGLALEHQSTVSPVAYSPNGTTILTGTSNGEIRLWDLHESRPAAQRLGHGLNWIVAVAFSTDGKTVLTAGANPLFPARGLVWLRERATGKAVGEPIRFDHPVLAAAFSPDGGSLAVGCGMPYTSTGGAYLRSLRQPNAGLMKLEHDHYPVWSVAYSHDGRTLATGSLDPNWSTGDARLWDAATRRLLHVLKHPVGGVLCVAFSPDGRTLVSGGYDHTARFWNVATGQAEGPVLTHPREVFAVAFSPDGRTVLTGGFDGATRLWDRKTGAPVGKVLRHRGWVRAVGFSPDGQTVLTGGMDGSARLWDATRGLQVGPPIQHESWVLSVAFSPDGRSVLTGSRDTTAILRDLPPPIEGDPATVSLRVQVLTGMILDERDVVRPLSVDEWKTRRDLLLKPRPAGTGEGSLR